MLNENIIEHRIIDITMIYIIKLKLSYHFKMLYYSKDKYKLLLNTIITVIFREDYTSIYYVC